MFHSLDDYKKDDDKKKKKKEGTNFFVGGTDSALDVENPDSAMDKIVNKAKENAEQHEGGGDGDSAEAMKLRVKLYSNGFQIDDEPFRDSEGPENAQFLKELGEGYVPRELQ
jgi:hypothetical protein